MNDPDGSTPTSPEPPSAPRDRRGTVASPLGMAAVQATEPGGGRVAAFDLSAWAVARYTLVIAAVVGGIYLLWKIQEVLMLLLLAILFATAIEPLVNRLRSGPFSRGQGILIVYSIIFGLLAGVGFFFVPGIVDQASQFIDSLPEQVASLRPLVEQIGIRPIRELLLRGIGEAPAFQRTLEQPVAAAEAERLVAAGGAVAHWLFRAVTIFLLTYYWLTERAAIKRVILRLVPESSCNRVNIAWLEVESKLGGWVRGQLLIMLALGLMSGAAFLLLGLPNPLLLAVLAGLCEIIPLIGPFLAFVPALLVALTVDPARALLLIPLAVLIQQIEGNILVPRVMSHTIGISPLTVILGILIGSILYGLAGAFLAVPVAAAAQVILNEVLRQDAEAPPPGIEVVGSDGPEPVPGPSAEQEQTASRSWR